MRILPIDKITLSVDKMIAPVVFIATAVGVKPPTIVFDPKPIVPASATTVSVSTTMVAIVSPIVSITAPSFAKALPIVSALDSMFFVTDAIGFVASTTVGGLPADLPMKQTNETI